jgi:hypothetical protein
VEERIFFAEYAEFIGEKPEKWRKIAVKNRSACFSE